MSDGYLTDWPTSERFPHYTRANAGEVMGDPVSPLAWTWAWEGAMVLGMRDGWIRGGTHELSDFDEEFPETFGMFGGYFYLNLSSVRIQGVRNPGVTVEQLDTAFFGEHPDVPPYVPHPDDEKPHLVEKIDANTAFVMSATTWPEIEQDKADADELRASRGDLTQWSDADLVARLRDMRPMLQHLFEQHTISGSSAAVAPGILGVVGEAIGDRTIPMKLLAGIGDVDSALPNHALWAMSRRIRESDALTAAFDAGIDDVLDRLAADGSDDAATLLSDWDAFITEFGSRGPNEWDIRADSWETRPALPLAALDRLRHQSDDESPHLRHDAMAEQRRQVIDEVGVKVAGDAELEGMFEAALVAGNMMAYRERTKSTIVKVIHEGRMVALELGRRHAEAGNLDDPDHIFMLLEGELDGFVADPAAFRQLLATRAADYATLWDLEPPFIIRDGDPPAPEQWPRKSEADAGPALDAGDELTGISGSPGVVRGIARIVLDPADPTALDPGDILVAPFTDPSWTPLFMTAGGVVVDVGGQISHAVIVSRELGLPCVVVGDRRDRPHPRRGDRRGERRHRCGHRHRGAVTEGFDLSDPEVQQDPQPHYDAMRDDGVRYVPANDAFLVLRHDDCLTVLRDPHTYSSRLGSNREQPPEEVRDEIAAIAAQGLPRPRTLLDNDPPDHARFRRLVARAFTPRKMAELRPFVESLADGLIDDWDDPSSVEFVEQFAVLLPGVVVAHALNIPAEREDDFRRWSDASTATIGGSISAEQHVELATINLELQQFFVEQFELRRTDPQDDLLTTLLQSHLGAAEDGSDLRPLDMPELVRILQQLLVAGHETTAKLITEIVRLLAETDGAWDRIREHPESDPPGRRGGLADLEPEPGHVTRRHPRHHPGWGRHPGGFAPRGHVRGRQPRRRRVRMPARVRHRPREPARPDGLRPRRPLLHRRQPGPPRSHRGPRTPGCPDRLLSPARRQHVRVPPERDAQGSEAPPHRRHDGTALSRPPGFGVHRASTRSGAWLPGRRCHTPSAY